MSSAFDAMFERVALPSALAFNGEAILYTPLGGDAKIIQAIVDRGEGWKEDNVEDGLRLQFGSEIKVRVSDCPNLRCGDRFRIDEVDLWLSHVPRANDSGLATVALTRTQYTEKSDGGMRRQRQ